MAADARVAMQVVQESGEIVETPLTPEELQLTWNRSVCPYCGVGCGVLVGSKDGRVRKVRGDPNHPANYGLLCGKGATLPQMVHTPDRLTTPLIRASREEDFQRASWDEALERIATRWQRIIRDHGPDAVAFYVSGQLLTEDYYVVNKLAKGFLGTNNVDSNSRLCMASAVSGYVTSLGADAPPGCYADIELADSFLLIGTNTAACHPVTFERIRRRKLRAPARVNVVVVDPRKTRTADIADVYLPIRPGTDVALLNAMLHVIAREGLLDARYMQRHTSDWERLQPLLERYSPDQAAAICGVEAGQIRKAALLFAKARAAMSFWSMGLNQSTHGTAKNNCVINLHLATGQIGRPGAGPFSLTGQPNAMGGRETGGLAHLLPGHRFVAKEQDRRAVEGVWGVSEGRINAKPGLTAVELFNALADGRVKSVWILCTNPMVSMPNLSMVRQAFAAAELVIVNDIYHPTETTQLADIILPAAQWSERDGTVTNSERAISYLEQAIDPPGEALPDWQILCRFARAMGLERAFAFDSAEAIYEEYKRLTHGQDLDIGGVTYRRLKQAPIQWPCPTPGHRSTMRRYTGGVFAHPGGKAHFIAHEYETPAEMPDAQFPLILTTGRVRDQWHTMTRTGKVPVLMKKEPEPFIELHPADAAPLGIAEGDLIVVHSRRGQAQAACRVTETIKPGTCFMPFHWGSLRGEAVVNRATVDACDPISKQPELKFCAVRVEKMGHGAGGKGQADA
ncbi:MAG: nitrate reductase [Candidatus Omnitrophica bacterium CG11_big_fil_rev_8_21_14_0_20_63_9]|nr:MAG: nitrate reductase [Candidatus Omnitrophica bacterium CG11_big_fil_rev_8_21_14_0_20_63_9]